MNLVKRLFQDGVDRFKRGKGCEAQRSKAVWQHQSDAKQGTLRDLTFRNEANMQAINMLMDSPSWHPNWWLLSACARRSQSPCRLPPPLRGELRLVVHPFVLRAFAAAALNRAGVQHAVAGDREGEPATRAGAGDGADGL